MIRGIDRFGFYAKLNARIVYYRVLLSIVAPLFARTTTLLFGGDIMLNGIAPSPKVFANIRPLAAKSDLVFGNLEIPLTSSQTKTSRKSAAELLKKDQWILKANPEHAAFLANAGINAVSLANNHAMDYGPGGLSQMTSLLDKNHISHAGAGLNADQAMQGTVISSKNHKSVSLLSVMGFQTTGALLKTTPATLTSPGIGVLNLKGRMDSKVRSKLTGWIGRAKRKSEFVVVAIHWGVERKSIPNPYQVQLGRALVDAGADIVWGNHPHVLQGAELYRGKLIMYSMGNMISNLPAKGGFINDIIDDQGHQKVFFAPTEIRGGQIRTLSGPARTTATLEMKRLCQLLVKRYPSPVSTPALK